MERNTRKISEGSAYGREGNHFQRFIQELRTLTAGRSAGTLGHRRMLPPDADPSVSVRRLFLGSTLEFMQREYFSEPQPKRNQRDGI